uniref:Uncharacterized protein MANES_12G042400 n=1 Tax=Rhizophora mucronata TaxID=61149 RepID=A0A2P2IMY7_RHIMU
MPNEKTSTFSETRLLLPFNNSGAIHGSVPLTPPDTSVLCLILDNPKSATLHIGRWGSLRFTSKLSHFRSKWTIFFECKYSMPKAASMAIISFLRRSSDLSFLSRTCLRDPFTIYSVTVAKVPPAPSGTTP